MKKILLLFILAAMHFPSFGQPGSLDGSFGNNGILRTDFGSADGNFKSLSTMLVGPDGQIYIITSINGKETIITRRFSNFVLDSAYGTDGQSVPVPGSASTAILQPDGKIVIGGSSMVNNTADFTLYRFQVNGFLDETFSSDGKQTTDFSKMSDRITSIALQKDGKILVAGSSSIVYTAINDVHVVRYNSDGALDENFSGDGKLTTSFSAQVYFPLVFVNQNNGKITVAGSRVEMQQSKLAIARLISNGQPDYTFADSGKAVIELSVSLASVGPINMQPDGKMIIAFTKYVDDIGLHLARLNEDASLDTQFSDDGIQKIKFGSIQTGLTAISVQDNGKILVSGSRFVGYDEFFIGRLNHDGALDSSFSEDGFDMRAIGNYSQQAGTSLAVLRDGRILMAAYWTNFLGMARYNINGSLDNNFGVDGIYIDNKYSLQAGQVYFYASALQPDGKIVVAGAISVTTPYDVNELKIFVGRFNPDGKIDSSFSDDGKQVISWLGQAQHVIIQPDGKILVAGSGSYANVTRLHADGSFDSTFSGNGKLFIDFGSSSQAVNKIYLQPDGKITLVGFSGGDLAIARCHTDGSLDNSFSGDGKLLVDLGLSNEPPQAVIMQPDGKILLIGIPGIFFPRDFTLLRLNTDGSADLTFGMNGKVSTDIAGGSDYATTALLQADGKIIVAGYDYFDPYLSGMDFVVVRYNSNGSLDSSFSGDGKLRLDVQSKSEGATTIALQADHKILVAGSTNGNKYAAEAQNNPGDFAIIRLNRNGTLDESFASHGIMVQDFGPADGIATLNISGNRIYAVGRTSYLGEIGIIAAYQIGDINQPPIAGAWFQKYYSPTSALLAAWDSNDPEGGPITYLWEKTAGPEGSGLLYSNSASPVVTGLVDGTYSFRLTVTDAQGAMGTAMLTFEVLNNLPPIAGAWLQKYYSPTSVLLAAWDSHDPEGGLITYLWQKVAGPEGSTLLYWNSASPVVTGLVNGTYTYRLTVTDNQGATASKELTFTVSGIPLSSNRAQSLFPADEKAKDNKAGQLIVYPNPVKDILNFRWVNEYTGTVMVTVMDISGRKIQDIRINKTTQHYNGSIELPRLKPGQYYLHIRNKSNTFTTAFRKE
jgi:uncharacterized delta-60 repeat protein